MTEPTNVDNSTTSLSQYLAPLRRHGRVVVLVTAVTLVLGVLMVLIGPKRYTATTSIVVLPVSADATEALEATDRTADMATETRIAASQAVAEATSERFRELAVDITPREADASIQVVNSPEDSRVIDVSYQASDPAVARVGSELAASAYLDYRSQLNTTTVDASREAVNAEIAMLQDRLVDVERRLDQTTAGSSARLVVEVEKTSIEGELAAQQRALAGLSTLAIDIATVIDEAREPLGADGLGPAQLLAGALAGGLVLGVIAAWMLDMLGLDAGGVGTSIASARPARTPRREKIRKPRKAKKEKEPADADDPFDDSDSRDPLELLKQLDAIEADPKLIAAMTRKKETKPEPESSDEAGTGGDGFGLDGEKSFSELYPVDFFDADGGAGELIDRLEHPAEGSGDADGATATDAAGVPDVPAVPAELAGAPTDEFDDEPAADHATGFDTDSFTSASPSPVHDPDPEPATAVGSENGDDDAPTPIDERFGPPPALGGLASFDSLPELETLGASEAPGELAPPSDELPPLDELPPPSPSFVDVGTDDDDPFGTDLPDAFGVEAGDVAEPDFGSVADAASFDDGGSIIGAGSGDPERFDPGPPSWDGPFVGPTTWDELASAPAGAEPPAPADLVASNDLAPLVAHLRQLEADGPVTVLSVSDGSPTAGLTAGFEVADELRALGTKVLLIDARIEDPALDALFEGGPGIGLAQVMSGEIVLDQAIRSLEGLDGLYLLTIGTVGHDTESLLTGPAFERVISQAQLDYHSIMVIGESIVGEYPEQPVADDRTRAVAAATDGVIVGTGRPVGSPASPQLIDVLSSLPVPTLHLIAAQAAAAAEVSSV